MRATATTPRVSPLADRLVVVPVEPGAVTASGLRDVLIVSAGDVLAFMGDAPQS